MGKDDRLGLESYTNKGGNGGLPKQQRDISSSLVRSEVDYTKKLMLGEVRERSKKQHGIYLDKDIEEALEYLISQQAVKKGVKTDVVNEALRKHFNELGVFKKVQEVKEEMSK